MSDPYAFHTILPFFDGSVFDFGLMLKNTKNDIYKGLFLSIFLSKEFVTKQCVSYIVDCCY